MDMKVRLAGLGNGGMWMARAWAGPMAREGCGTRQVERKKWMEREEWVEGIRLCAIYRR